MSVQGRVLVQPKIGAFPETWEATFPDPSGHRVRVRILNTAICHTELHFMTRQREGLLLFGHEAYGVVDAVGYEVTGLAQGDRVVVTFVPGSAPDGRVAESAELDFGARGVGRSRRVYTWADYAVVDELHVVPVELPTEVEADASILGCAVVTGAGASWNCTEVGPDASVAVFGVGGVGLSAVVGARMKGAREIIAIDRSAEKLKLARQLGATDTVDVADVGEVGEWRQMAMGGLGADVVIDCVGSSTSVDQCLSLARAGVAGASRGGQVVLVGLAEETPRIAIGRLIFDQISLIGSFGGDSSHESIQTFATWARDGELPLSALVTDRYSFEEIDRAIDDLDSGRVTGRAVVNMGSNR